MQGNLCVLDNAAFLYFLYWVSPIKRQKKKKKAYRPLPSLVIIFLRLTFKKFDLSKKRSKEKSFNYLFYWKKKNKASLIYIERLSYFWIYLQWTERGLLVLPFRDQKLPDPPALPPIPLRKRGRPAWGNRLGYYGAFMLPSCVVWPKQRPRVKASCKIYVHAAVSVGGKINIAGLMHGDDWVLSDWQ